MRSEVSNGRKSAKVSTAWTPGWAFAALTSMLFNNPCATGLRRNAMCSASGTVATVTTAEAQAQPAAAPAPQEQPGYAFLNIEEAAFVEVLVDHMVPAD